MCGEIASAAGGTRPSILECRRAAHRNRAAGLDPRAAHRPRARPSITSSTVGRIFLPFFAVFAKNRQKTAEPGSRIWSEFSAKNRELAENRQFCQKKTRTGLRDPRPLLNEIRRTDRQIRQGPRPIGSDRWPSIIGSAPAIRRAHTRPAGCKGHVSDK